MLLKNELTMLAVSAQTFKPNSVPLPVLLCVAEDICRTIAEPSSQHLQPVWIRVGGGEGVVR